MGHIVCIWSTSASIFWVFRSCLCWLAHYLFLESLPPVFLSFFALALLWHFGSVRSIFVFLHSGRVLGFMKSRVSCVLPALFLSHLFCRVHRTASFAGLGPSSFFIDTATSHSPTKHDYSSISST